VDPVRISQTVRKNLLKNNTNYEKQEMNPSDATDVNLLSKDQELNFTNKHD